MKLEPSGQSSSITLCRRLNWFLAGDGSTVQPDEKTIVRVPIAEGHRRRRYKFKVLVPCIPPALHHGSGTPKPRT